MTALQVALIILGAVFLSIGLPRVREKRNPSPVSASVGKLLDSNLRRRLQPLDKIIERSGIERGMNVLDLGCGSGASTALAARAVGEWGKVYAVDIQPAMLQQLERKLARAENQDLRNIEIIEASAYELPFEDESIDLVFMVAALPEINDRGRALREVRRILKPGGILAITEFLPDPDYPLRSTTIKLCQGEGFVLDASSGNFWNYTVRFKKPT